MNRKEKQLLEQLAGKRSERMTGYELADKLDVSARSIRNYIRNLEPLSKDHGFRIDSRPSLGYELIIEDEAKFAALMGWKKKEVCEADPAEADNADKRRKWMMDQMLLQGEPLVLEDLPELFFVSECTIRKDIMVLRERCSEYGLKIEQYLGKLSIQGPERAKRTMIREYFLSDSRAHSLHDYLNFSPLFADLPISMMLRVLLEEFRRAGLHFSDVQIQNILLHLALSLRRVKEGKVVSDKGLQNLRIAPAALKTAGRILEQISRSLQLSFPESEIRYLALHLSGTGQEDETKTRIEGELDTILAILAEDDVLQTEGDELLKQALLEHLLPMISRIQSQTQLENPLREEIRQQAGGMFEITRKYFSMMPAIRRYSVSDDEWAYLCLHLQAAAERYKKKEKIQTLILCATGYGSSQLLKSRLQKVFSEDINIVAEAGYLEMNDDALKNIDLIISSVNIGSVIFNVPFVQVSIFLGEEDQKKIKACIDSFHERKTAVPRLVSPNNRTENQAVFDAWFDKERFFLAKEPMSREQGIDVLVESMANGERNGFDDSLKEQIAIRSQLGCVAFSDTIVVEHPAIPLAETGRFALMLLPQKMAWSEEFPGIQFLFLMSPSRLGNQGLEKITNGIVTLIEREDLQKQILADQTYETFRRCFLECMEG